VIITALFHATTGGDDRTITGLGPKALREQTDKRLMASSVHQHDHRWRSRPACPRNSHAIDRGALASTCFGAAAPDPGKKLKSSVSENYPRALASSVALLTETRSGLKVSSIESPGSLAAEAALL